MHTVFTCCDRLPLWLCGSITLDFLNDGYKSLFTASVLPLLACVRQVSTCAALHTSFIACFGFFFCCCLENDFSITAAQQYVLNNFCIASSSLAVTVWRFKDAWRASCALARTLRCTAAAQRKTRHCAGMLAWLQDKHTALNLRSAEACRQTTSSCLSFYLISEEFHLLCLWNILSSLS